jgi:hypothetical protein
VCECVSVRVWQVSNINSVYEHTRPTATPPLPLPLPPPADPHPTAPISANTALIRAIQRPPATPCHCHSGGTTAGVTATLPLPLSLPHTATATATATPTRWHAHPQPVRGSGVPRDPPRIQHNIAERHARQVRQWRQPRCHCHCHIATATATASTTARVAVAADGARVARDVAEEGGKAGSGRVAGWQCGSGSVTVAVD